MTETQLIDVFVRAWAKKEGFFDKKKIPSVSQRLNNPCNLSHWHDREGNPYPEQCGLAEFPDEETGLRAAKSQARINLLKRRLTFLEFFAGKPGVYRGACPRDEARQFDPRSYATDVARTLAPDASIHVVVATLVTPNANASKPVRNAAPR